VRVSIPENELIPVMEEIPKNHRTGKAGTVGIEDTDCRLRH